MIPYVILAIEDESDRAFMAELYLNYHTTDDPDGSFLEATMERLQLHELNTKKIVPWSMRHPHTAYAWGVQTNNMTLSLGQSVGGQYRDVIRIEHDTRTH